MDITEIARQVQYNCDVSDARHAGIYSICGLAMRLRDLYKWDRQLPPWKEDEAGMVLDWIGQRETLWESLENAEFEPLSIDGHQFDPFDTQAINDVLAPRDYFYGAGYAHSLKPTFFLAGIEKRQTIRNYPVWYLGRELARDLLTLPAFAQDDQVVLRTEAARMFLWDQIAYISNSSRPALAFALAACCNLPDTNEKGIRQHLNTILKVQQNTYVQHELSELDEPVFDHATWRQMMADFPHTAVELLIRTLKDTLADTAPQGPLAQFVTDRNKAGLGFYMAFLGGLAPHLFCELKSGFARFVQTGDWQKMAQAVTTVHDKAADYTRQIIDIYTQGCLIKDTASIQAEIEKTLVERGVKIRDE